jgi:hypothetical protein
MAQTTDNPGSSGAADKWDGYRGRKADPWIVSMSVTVATQR